MNNQDENSRLREGLETARCPTGVGSNPTPPASSSIYTDLEDYENRVRSERRMVEPGKNELLVGAKEEKSWNSDGRFYSATTEDIEEEARQMGTTLE